MALSVKLYRVVGKGKDRLNQKADTPRGLPTGRRNSCEPFLGGLSEKAS